MRILQAARKVGQFRPLFNLSSRNLKERRRFLGGRGVLYRVSGKVSRKNIWNVGLILKLRDVEIVLFLFLENCWNFGIILFFCNNFPNDFYIPKLQNKPYMLNIVWKTFQLTLYKSPCPPKKRRQSSRNPKSPISKFLLKTDKVKGQLVMKYVFLPLSIITFCILTIRNLEKTKKENEKYVQERYRRRFLRLDHSSFFSPPGGAILVVEISMLWPLK